MMQRYGFILLCQVLGACVGGLIAVGIGDLGDSTLNALTGIVLGAGGVFVGMIAGYVYIEAGRV